MGGVTIKNRLMKRKQFVKKMNIHAGSRRYSLYYYLTFIFEHEHNYILEVTHNRRQIIAQVVWTTKNNNIQGRRRSGRKKPSWLKAIYQGIGLNYENS